MGLTTVMVCILLGLLFAGYVVYQKIVTIQMIRGLTYTKAVKNKFGKLREQKQRFENSIELEQKLINGSVPLFAGGVTMTVALWIFLSRGVDIGQAVVLISALVISGCFVKAFSTKLPEWLGSWSYEMSLVMIDTELTEAKNRFKEIRDEVVRISELKQEDVKEEDMVLLPSLVVEADQLAKAVLFLEEQRQLLKLSLSQKYPGIDEE